MEKARVLHVVCDFNETAEWTRDEEDLRDLLRPFEIIQLWALIRCGKQAYSITRSARRNMEVGIVRMLATRLQGHHMM